MVIIYLAWGSLYWNPDILPINHWIYSTLELPLEFSRISDKGKGRLTLVIDEKNGVNNKIWYGISTERNVNKAINMLKIREKTSHENIAYINLKNGKKRFNHTPLTIVKKIEQWAISKNIDAVIWTDLKSNWKDIMHSKYTVEKAYKYFENSDLDVKIKILEYVYKAKHLAKINTPFSKYFFYKIK